MLLDRALLSELQDSLEGERFALDFETYGTNWMSSGFWIRCASFHNDAVSLCVEVADQDGNYYPYALEFFQWLATQTGIIAHNAGYEIGCLYAMTDQIVTPYACTYALLGSLANEGSPGASWALKKAGPELLMCEPWDKQIGKKSEMGRLPFDILGWYCQQDSWATWELYKSCDIAVNEHWDTWGQHFWSYQEEDVINLLMLQHEAYIHGLYVDLPYIEGYEKKVNEEIVASLDAVYNHPDLQPHIEDFNENVVSVARSEVENYSSKFKNDGEITINYQKKLAKFEIIKQEQHFNIGSPDHMKWLFYSRLKCDIKVFTDTGLPSMDEDALDGIPVYGKLVINYRSVHNKRQFLRGLRDNAVNGIVRISIKIPGTVTGRCSAGALEEL